jgi:hypothetical protein
VKVSTNEKGDFVVARTDDKTGTVKDGTVYAAEQRDDISTVAKVFRQNERAHGAIRRAFLSFCALVASQPRLDGFIGKADKELGKLPKELKAAWRDAESAIFDQFVTEGCAWWAEKDKATGETKFDEMGKQKALSILRADANYERVAATVRKFIGFVGLRPARDDGRLYPVEVMLAMIAEAMPRTNNPENSGIVADLDKMIQEWDALTKDADMNQATVIRGQLVALLSKVDDLREELAKVATQARTSAGAVAAAAIHNAKTTEDALL